MAAPSDTSSSIEQFVIEGYRRMTPADKLARVVALNKALEQLASAGLHSRHGPEISDGERRLRLGALRLDASVMRKVFGWDTDVHGL